MNPRRSLLAGGVAALCFAFGLGAALAQDKTFDLKLSHWVPPSHPLQKSMEEWGASIEHDSGGTIHYKVFPAQQLGKAFDEWYRQYAATEMKDIHYCFAFTHDPGTFHSRSKKIMVPADLKGMKIRPSHATMASLVTSLGGTNVEAAAPEVRDVLERGVADAVTFPWGSI